MARVDLYDDPFQARDPYRPPMPGSDVFNDVTYKNGVPVGQKPKNPYAVVNVPGHQPSADEITPQYRQPQSGPGPFGAPTGGINPYNTTTSADPFIGMSRINVQNPGSDPNFTMNQVLQHYGHSPLSPRDAAMWLSNLQSGRTTWQNFENEVRNTMSQPGAAKYNYGPPIGSTGPTGSTQTTNQPFGEAEFYQMFPNQSLSPAELLAKEGDLGKYGVKVQRNAEGIAGKIVLPNGQVVDVIEGASRGLNRRQYLTGPSGGGGASTFGGAQEFTDPLTAQYESLAKTRIDQLFNPIPNGPDTSSMIEQLRKRSTELQGPAYSPGDREVLRTQYSDPLAAQRDAAKQQVIQRLAAQGIQGGIVERALQEVDRNFDAMLAANNRQLSQNEITRGDQRQSESVDLQKYLAAAEQARIAFQEGRYQDAVNLSNQLSQLPERRVSLANSVLTGGQSPQDVFNSLLNFGQAGQYQTNYQNQQRDLYLQQAIAVLAKLFK